MAQGDFEVIDVDWYNGSFWHQSDDLCVAAHPQATTATTTTTGSVPAAAKAPGAAPETATPSTGGTEASGSVKKTDHSQFRPDRDLRRKNPVRS